MSEFTDKAKQFPGDELLIMPNGAVEIPKLVITPIGGKDWKLFEELRWEIGVKGSNDWLIVPEGFITDLASTPRFLHWWLSPAGQPQILSATLHDWIYRVPQHRTPSTATRKQADFIFRDSMKALGVNGARRWLMWAGVRVGGFKAFKKGEAHAS